MLAAWPLFKKDICLALDGLYIHFLFECLSFFGNNVHVCVTVCLILVILYLCGGFSLFQTTYFVSPSDHFESFNRLSNHQAIQWFGPLWLQGGGHIQFSKLLADTGA